MNARLDRMEGEQEIAQLAATLGREFSHELLAAVATAGRSDSPGRAGQAGAGGDPVPERPAASAAHTSSSTPCSKMRCTTRWSRSKRQEFHRRVAAGIRDPVPADRRMPAGVARPPFHRSGPDRKGRRVLAAGRAAVEGTVRRRRGDRPPDERPRVVEHARGNARARQTGNCSSSPRSARRTSRSADTPRPKSGRSAAGPRSLPSGSGIRNSSSASCWACGNGGSCAAICGSPSTSPPTGWRSPKA